MDSPGRGELISSPRGGNQVKGGVLCRRSEPLTWSAARRVSDSVIPLYSCGFRSSFPRIFMEYCGHGFDGVARSRRVRCGSVESVGAGASLLEVELEPQIILERPGVYQRLRS